MTKGEIKGQVYLKISGGEPSADVSVWLDDLDILVAPAVNYVNLKQYFIDANNEEERHMIQPFMLQTFTVSINNDSVRKRKYIELPATPLSLPNKRALHFVGDVRGKSWIPLQQNGGDMQEYYCKFKKGIVSYEAEGKRCYLYNETPFDTQALVKMLVNVHELSDEDQIMLPSGSELEVATLIYEWITGQREMPKDLKVDSKDKPGA